MRTAKVLFIGGTGLISSACLALAHERGLSVTAVVRGRTTSRPLPPGVRQVTADVTDPQALAGALDGERFDAVVNFIAFTPEQVQADVDLFGGRTGQYVFVSSTAVYSKPVGRLPLTESSPVRSLNWRYAQDKIHCEELLEQAFRRRDFPAVIVRPGHTYDRTAIPLLGGWTAVDRLRRGEPVIVHGDGSSLRPMTHARDFARGFVPLLGDGATIGDRFHITSDDAPSWNFVYAELARAAGVTKPRLIHLTTDTIAGLAPDWAGYLRGDGSASMMFDNTKIKRAVPGFAATTSFAEGAREMVCWHDADPVRRRPDPAIDALLDKLTALGPEGA
ncbi:MAG TPA: NAD-dependent epimerase/dehydratase family protein [Streptosporangiaceae bacterium]|nr:NAD-dependent epimerase/dehydratase family protein [Streptosporangiaceae bacterium]